LQWSQKQEKQVPLSAVIRWKAHQCMARGDTKIGSIERVMIDKLSGKVAYAVLSFGGFLGIGDDHYPLPWQSLKYDPNLGGYRTKITESQLKGAPKYSNDNAWNWNDPAWTRSVNDYYGIAS
jgi:hypothetical protein